MFDSLFKCCKGHVPRRRQKENRCTFVFITASTYSMKGELTPYFTIANEPLHDKTSKMACAPSEDSDQPGHPPSLIRVFAVRTKKAWVLSYPLSARRRLWSVWADAQADLNLRWARSHWFCHEALLVLSWGGSNQSIVDTAWYPGPANSVYTRACWTEILYK